MVFTITDHHSVTTQTTITLDQNYSAGGLNSIVEAINIQIGVNGLRVVAEATSGVLGRSGLWRPCWV